MKRLIRYVFFLCLILLAGCVTSPTKHESIYFHMPGTDWKVGYHKEMPPLFIITEFIREGDDIDNWRELFTVHNWSMSWGGPSPEDTLNQPKAIREKDCPGATVWNVIEKDENSILYEWQSKPCLGWPDQYEIAKIIYGKYNRFQLRYTTKVYQLPPDKRDEWIEKFRDYKIETTISWKSSHEQVNRSLTSSLPNLTL